MVIFCSLPVPRSFAETLTMPFASMSKVTSICGTPRGAGGRPTRWNLPSVRLSRAIDRSPCSTCTSTLVWLSDAVEKTSLLRVGIVVFRGISVVITPPIVSIPSDSGVTSSSSRSLTSPASTPACTAAPTVPPRRADRDDFVGVDALVRLLAEQVLDDLLDLRNARRSADQHHFVDLRRVHAGVGQRLTRRADGLLQEIVDELFELR